MQVGRLVSNTFFPAGNLPVELQRGTQKWCVLRDWESKQAATLRFKHACFRLSVGVRLCFLFNCRNERFVFFIMTRHYAECGICGGRFSWLLSHSFLGHMAVLHRVRKKGAILLLPLTLPYADWFSKFFRRQT